MGSIGFESMPLNLFPDANYPVVSVIISEPDAAATDVANALQRIQSKLPADILPPEIFRVSDATAPVFTLALNPRADGNLDLEKVRQLADNEIREDFLRIPEVANVEVFGGYFPEISVDIEPTQLHAYGLSLDQVLIAIRAQNVNIPDGLIIRRSSQFLVKTEGKRLHKEDLGRIIVAHKKSGGEVYLRDIASIHTGYRERQSLYRGNGKAAIGVNLLRAEEGHVTTTIAAVGTALPSIERKYPGVVFEIADTQKTVIETSIGNMVDALRDSVMMTLAVIFLFLANTRISILAAISWRRWTPASSRSPSKPSPTPR